MSEIVLTEEQSKVAAATLQPVDVRDARGNIVGVFSPVWTQAEIAEAKRRLASAEPRYTTAQVIEHLKSLRRT